MAASDLFLCLDQGGHASRAIVCDRRGRQLAAAFVPIRTRRDGARVEHDPEELVRSLREAATAAVGQLGDAARRLAGAGLATQRSSIVCWEHTTGVALTPVLSWQDTRAAEWLADFREHQARIHEITGLVLSPHYGVSKLHWCLTHVPAVQAARSEGTLMLGPLASFLAGRLTNAAAYAADPANASRTLLWDRHTGGWSAELLKIFGLPRACLPRAAATRSDWGTITVGAREVPLVIVTGDQSAALFAFGKPDSATVYANLGTGAFVQRVAGDAVPDPGRLLASVVYQDAAWRATVIEGTVNGAGSAINAVSAELGMQMAAVKAASRDWLDAFAADLLYLNAVSGLGSPWWRADLHSRFAGSAAGTAHDSERIAAVLESIAFLIVTNLDAMRAVLGEPARLLATGGLAAVDPLLSRIASLAELPVERTSTTEATARGLACLLAGMPADWPAATIQSSFPSVPDAALAARYRRWLELMPEL